MDLDEYKKKGKSLPQLTPEQEAAIDKFNQEMAVWRANYAVRLGKLEIKAKRLQQLADKVNKDAQ